MHVRPQRSVTRAVRPERLPARAVEDDEVVGERVAVRVRERTADEDTGTGVEDRVDARRLREDPVRPRGVRAECAPLRAVPLGDLVGLRDPGDVREVAADVHVRTARSHPAHPVGHGPASLPGSASEREPLPAAVCGDVVRRRDVVEIAEAAARVEDAAVVEGQPRHHARGIEDDGPRGPGVQVASDQVVRVGDARASLERTADVDRRAGDLERVDVAARPRRLADGRPLRPVPDGEETGVGVAAGWR